MKEYVKPAIVSLIINLPTLAGSGDPTQVKGAYDGNIPLKSKSIFDYGDDDE